MNQESRNLQDEQHKEPHDHQDNGQDQHGERSPFSTLGRRTQLANTTAGVENGKAIPALREWQVPDASCVSLVPERTQDSHRAAGEARGQAVRRPYIRQLADASEAQTPRARSCSSPGGPPPRCPDLRLRVPAWATLTVRQPGTDLTPQAVITGQIGHRAHARDPGRPLRYVARS